MQKIIACFCFFFVNHEKIDTNWSVTNYAVYTIISDDVAFALAIARVESNFNYSAYNHNEQAHGILQIRPIALKCVNDYYKTNYSIADCYTHKAFTIFRLYIQRWGANLSYYDKARIWNGGAFGYKKESTKPYADKVIATMNNYKKIKL